jgi:hypothetical protein
MQGESPAAEVTVDILGPYMQSIYPATLLATTEAAPKDADPDATSSPESPEVRDLADAERECVRA